MSAFSEAADASGNPLKSRKIRETVKGKTSTVPAESNGTPASGTEEVKKERRGRPRKVTAPAPADDPVNPAVQPTVEPALESPMKRKRGRPKKNPEVVKETSSSQSGGASEVLQEERRRGRGRPRKSAADVDEKSKLKKQKGTT